MCTYDETADGRSRSTRKLVLDRLKMKDHSEGTLALGQCLLTWDGLGLINTRSLISTLLVTGNGGSALS